MAVASTEKRRSVPPASPRAFVYLFLLLFALFYLLPFGIMLINSLKPLEGDHRRRHGRPAAELDDRALAERTGRRRRSGCSPRACRPYFINSIMMAVPAVILSTVVGALNGYVLTKWRFRGDYADLRAVACFRASSRSRSC